MKASEIMAIVTLTSFCLAAGALIFALKASDELGDQTLNEWHWDVIIEEKRAEGYYISTITMEKKIDLINEQEIRIPEPNEASYKAFFGWE